MKIQVRIELRKQGIFHLIHIEQGKQILHELLFSFLKSKEVGHQWWRPSLVELEFFIEYFKFLHTLCKIKVYPTQQQLERILDENDLTVLDLFFRNEYGLFTHLPEKTSLEEQTQVALIDVLALPFKKAYIERNDLHFLITPSET